MELIQGVGIEEEVIGASIGSDLLAAVYLTLPRRVTFWNI
jgi:hypothetical protein